MRRTRIVGCYCRRLDHHRGGRLSGQHRLNMSLSSKTHDPGMESAIRRARQRKSWSWVAAENATRSWGRSPGRMPEVITVGASSSLDAKPVRYGPGVDIFDPGVRSFSVQATRIRTPTCPARRWRASRDGRGCAVSRGFATRLGRRARPAGAHANASRGWIGSHSTKNADRPPADKPNRLDWNRRSSGGRGAKPQRTGKKYIDLSSHHSGRRCGGFGLRPDTLVSRSGVWPLEPSGRREVSRRELVFNFS